VSGIPKEYLYCEDEMRYGTRTDTGRRWMPFGERPVCPMKIGYDFGLLYAAVCPFNGDLFAMFLPNMNIICFDIFQNALLEHIEQKVKAREEVETIAIEQIGLLMDQASCHTAATKVEQIKHLFFPPACPELNPAERFFKELRRALKLRVYHTIEKIEVKIKEILQKYWDNPNLMIKLTNFPCFNTQ
jgi:transposase